MDTKKMIIAVVSVFILYEVTNFLIHGLILAGTYQGLANVFRSMEEMNRMMWRMWIADLVWSFFFVFIFTKGYQNKGIMEGARYGLYIALFMNFMAAVAQNVVYPVPYTLSLQWFIFGAIQSIFLGIIIALILKPKTA
ncbi:MAG: hypothetical protein CVV24_04245 [Ignavibacteriae bacterium HGW-Ignavibacteriae-3]|nr:MAG: hypothetical protein CVV24_04245 [Ignavibacteriae bacterium HGW-Ignavibacteriae-3]